jgi:nitronate monooxygenase
MLACRTQLATGPNFPAAGPGHSGAKKLGVNDNTFLSTPTRKGARWTCGHCVYRLKGASLRSRDGSDPIASAEHVVRDCPFSVDHKVPLLA